MKVITTVQDPVCGMDVDAREPAGQTEYKSKTYYFCGPKCQAAFDANPAKYAAAAKAKEAKG